LTKWEIDVAVWSRFLKLRERLFKAIKEWLEMGGYCRPYEGRFDIEFLLPSYPEKGKEAIWRIHLMCYLVGPLRGHDWEGETFEEAFLLAERDIAGWLDGHDDWLKRYEKDPSITA